LIRYSKYHAWFCLFLVLLMTLVQPFAVFADVMTPSNAFVVNPDYLIGSASNADYGLMTMELNDDDYGISTLSTLGTVSNTLSDEARPRVGVFYYDSDEVLHSLYYTLELNSNGRYSFNTPIVNGYISQLNFYLTKEYKSLPTAGTYDMSFDYTSDFSYDYSSGSLRARDDQANVGSETYTLSLGSDFQQFSGDIYVSPITVDLGSVEVFYLRTFIPTKQKISQVGGSFAWHFEISSSEPEYSLGSNTSTEDYQSDVSGSLSDISSSIGDMSSSLDSAAENLEYISTSQNLIIQGIDNVIMHISDQLYAFWDQLYNLIHEPTYARLGDILDAIRNLDLEITVEMSEVTNAVNKMNQDMQNKLQNVQQTLTGGYDSSSMDSDNQELNSSLNEYESAENELFDDAKEHINSFEFDTDLGEFSTPLTDISYFLGSLFVGLGPMNVVISFSLTLTIAMVLIGWYRFKGGS